MARSFNEGLIKAMKEESDAEVLINQVSALKDIISECGAGFLTQEEIAFLSTKSVGMIDKSLERIASLEKMKNEEVEDEDEELEEEDLALIKEENQNEYDLQLCAAELMGTLFKVAPQQVADLVQELRSRVLKEAFESQVQKRLKFALFVLDDMVEHLGPTYFSEGDWAIIVQTIASFAGHKSASLRQASAYGIGVIAQHGGAGFAAHADFCLQALKSACEYQMSGKVQEKKSKSEQFHHARDNAIASIGKVIKFQTAFVTQNPAMQQQVSSYWLSNLPITHDVEEAQMQYQYLSEIILSAPEFLMGADPAGSAQQIARIFGEAFADKYFTESNKLPMGNAVRFMMDSSPAPVMEAFKAACQNVLSGESRGNVEAAYNFRG